MAFSCFLLVVLAIQAHAAGSFSPVSNMIQARYKHTATLLNNGQVLITGGCMPGANILNSAELYDPPSHSFLPTGTMVAQRCDHSATQLQDGTVLLAGGFGGGASGVLSSAEIYNPTTGTFSPTAGPMTSPRVFHLTALLQNGMVLIAGGNDGINILSSAELYDPSSGTFSPTSGGSFPTPMEGSNVLATPAAVLNDGTVLIPGGDNGIALLGSAQVYSPSNQSFTAAANSMTMPRWYHQVTLLQDGTVLITGGIDGPFLNSAETFDPISGLFAATAGNLSGPRIYHTSTLLLNGAVLIAGGIDNYYVTHASGDVYDPVARTFSQTGNLITPREFHTATLLQDGTVLIAGGSPDGFNGLATAELFTLPPPPPTTATTYYISYSTGANTNNGTSKSTPWKTHPYMQAAAACTGTGSAPAYVHNPGDTFIFMQGDSWPNACFDMVIQQGGGIGKSDQYTYDGTWGVVSFATPVTTGNPGQTAPTGTGAPTVNLGNVAPPGSGATLGNTGQTVGAYQFNAGGLVINGADGINRFIYDDNNDNITLNGVELTGVTWDGAGGWGDNAWLVDIQQTQNFVLSNCYAHNWTYTNPVNGGDALGVMVGNGNFPYNAGSRMSGCVIDGSNSGGPGLANSGDAVYAIPGCDNNIITNVTNGCLVNANASVHDNIIGPINPSLSAYAHPNCIEPIDPVAGGTSTVYIYNNVIHDCSDVAILAQGTPSAGSNEIDYIWNNVIYVGSVPAPPIPIQFDSVMNPNTGSEAHVWNNTMYGGPIMVCIRTIDEGNGNFNVLDFQNNFCMSDLGFATLPLVGNTQIFNNNVLMGTADAATAGLSSLQPFAYQPTAPDCGGLISTTLSCPVGAGTSLTNLATGGFLSLANDTTYGNERTPNARPSIGPVDAGAYQYVIPTPVPVAVQ